MITTKYLTANRTYGSQKKIIDPRYILTHSTGCGYKSKDNLFNSWNKATASKSCHGMTDDTGGYNTLPLNYRGWHCRDGNDTTIGFEICEPKNIVYKNPSTIDTEKYNPKDPAIIADFEKRYNNAVEMAAYMCKETGIPADRVISHAEAHKMGFASNHADVGHWFPLFGKSMDNFRADVKKALEGGEKTPAKKVYYRVQCGAFSKRENAERLQALLTAKGFTTIIKYDKYYRVQTGAFSKRENAVNMQKKLKAAGFDAIIREG